ncbi:MAG TPA: hypothetical protein EYP62_09065 [Kiritimatiellae bacterium]|nr:hypothetical protein [Kiritimatiellia bacterium]
MGSVPHVQQSVRWTGWTLLVWLVFSGARSAVATLQVEGSLFWMTPHGDVAVGHHGVSGTRVDLADDLGCDSAVTVAGGQIVVGDVHQLGLEVNRFSVSEETRLGRTIRFYDKTYPVSSLVESSLDMTLVKAFYRFTPGTSLARGGYMVGVQYVSAEVEAAASSVGSARGDVKSPMPFIGVYFASYPLPFLGFQATACGSRWDLGEVSASYVDIEVRLEMEFVLGSFMGIGYRYVGLDVEDDDLPAEADVVLSGPVIYAGWEW